MEDKINDLISNIRKIVRAIHLESKRIDKTYGVSVPQLLYLSYLKNCTDYKSSLTAIKKYMNLNASTVTGITTRLKQKGLLVKQNSNADKRVIEVVLTAKGLDLLQKAPLLMHEKLEKQLATLSSNDFNQLSDAIELLVNMLGAEHLEVASLISPDDLLS